MSDAAEIQKDYEEFWKDILEKDGKLDLEQLKKELYDFRNMIHEVTKVYDYITNGRISKPTTHAEAVIDMANEVQNELIKEEYVHKYEHYNKLRLKDINIKDAEDVIVQYADPESYFAIRIMADRPAGWFADDISETKMGYQPGKLARTYLKNRGCDGSKRSD